MQSEEKNLIDGLFSRLRDAEGQSAPRDPQAEGVIREHVARQPAAPYYMAQAIIVQENAIQRLDGRVKELEAQIEQLKQQVENATRQQSGGGFLSGLFGGGRSEPPPVARPQPVARPAAAGWNEPGYGNQGGFGSQGGFGQQPGFQRGAFGAPAGGGGGGFLSGALQTAAGVAGGMVLGNVLMDMFQGDEEPKVAEAAHEPVAAPEPQHQVAEENLAPQEDYFADSGEGDDFFGGDDEDFV